MMNDNGATNKSEEPIKPDPQERKETSEVRARTDIQDNEKPDWQQKQDKILREQKEKEKEEKDA